MSDNAKVRDGARGLILALVVSAGVWALIVVMVIPLF